MTTQVLGISSATGGLGASTLAAAVAVRAGLGGLECAVIDPSAWGVGVAVPLGMEDVPGLRWEDLRRADGTLPGAQLLAALPSRHGVHLLARDHLLPGANSPLRPSVIYHARRALASAVGLVIVDLPGVNAPDFLTWASWCSQVIVLVGSSPATVVVAPALRQRLSILTGEAALVVRGSVSGNGAVRHVVEDICALTVMGTLPQDRAVTSALTAGRPVGVTSGPLRDVADEALRRVADHRFAEPPVANARAVSLGVRS